MFKIHTVSDKSFTTCFLNISLLFNLRVPLKQLAVTLKMFHIKFLDFKNIQARGMVPGQCVEFEARVNQVKIKKTKSPRTEMKNDLRSFSLDYLGLKMNAGKHTKNPFAL